MSSTDPKRKGSSIRSAGNPMPGIRLAAQKGIPATTNEENAPRIAFLIHSQSILLIGLTLKISRKDANRMKIKLPKKTFENRDVRSKEYKGEKICAQTRMLLV